MAQSGRVRACAGNVIEGEGLRPKVGSLCSIEDEEGGHIAAEVVGFRSDSFLLMPLVSGVGLAPGARIHLERAQASVPVGEACLGRVLNGLGEPIDGRGPLVGATRGALYRSPEDPLRRAPIREPLDLGVRALNAFVSAGRGMRLGIFAGSGVGKSTLLGQIARFTAADVVVIALVGERGREVGEFLERDLGSALRRATVVVATSDEAPIMRLRAANAATAIAESYRDEGKQVLLLMDSLTRFCFASREVGLAAGEPPATRGYPPSVWSALPRLLERAGTNENGGSITGIYSVLVEGDDPNEPVADAARSILDGHIVLSRELAERGHFPPVDVLASISRVMGNVVNDGHRATAERAREALATYRRAEDLIAIGAYAAGSDPKIDAAQKAMGPLAEFLKQAPDERSLLAESVAGLGQIFPEGSG